MSALAQALLAFQKEAPDLHKDSKAVVPTKSGGQYSYRYLGLDGAMEKIRPLLIKHGLVLIQLPSTVDGQPALRTKLIHAESGEAEEDTMLLLGTQDPQGQGSAITYARRYSIMAVLGLVADEDDDGKRAQPRKEPKPVEQNGDESSDPTAPLRTELLETVAKLDHEHAIEGGWSNEVAGYCKAQGWSGGLRALDAAQLTELQSWFGSFLNPKRIYGPKAAKSQHTALAVLCRELEEKDHREDESWEDSTRIYAEREYGVKSRAQLTRDEMKQVIAHFQDLKEVPVA